MKIISYTTRKTRAKKIPWQNDIENNPSTVNGRKAARVAELSRAIFPRGNPAFGKARRRDAHSRSGRRRLTCAGRPRPPCAIDIRPPHAALPAPAREPSPHPAPLTGTNDQPTQGQVHERQPRLPGLRDVCASPWRRLVHPVRSNLSRASAPFRSVHIDQTVLSPFVYWTVARDRLFVPAYAKFKNTRGPKTGRIENKYNSKVSILFSDGFCSDTPKLCARIKGFRNAAFVLCYCANILLVYTFRIFFFMPFPPFNRSTIDTHCSATTLQFSTRIFIIESFSKHVLDFLGFPTLIYRFGILSSPTSIYEMVINFFITCWICIQQTSRLWGLSFSLNSFSDVIEYTSGNYIHSSFSRRKCTLKWNGNWLVVVFLCNLM